MTETGQDPDERDGLKFNHVTTRGELNELEQANVQNGLQWLRRGRSRRDVLNEAFLLQLHRRLFGEVWSWAGTFRRTEKNIGIDPLQVPMQLRMLLDDARYWARHETYKPLEAAARFHHRLVQIHCFANGNGRHARIAADAYLQDYFAHPPVDWAGGYDLLKDNQRRDAYIAALRAADAGDHDPLLRFVNALKD